MRPPNRLPGSGKSLRPWASPRFSWREGPSSTISTTTDFWTSSSRPSIPTRPCRTFTTTGMDPFRTGRPRRASRSRPGGSISARQTSTTMPGGAKPRAALDVDVEQAIVVEVCQTGGFNIGQTDFNNDGLLDIYVKRGAWLRTSGRMRDSLLRQNPDGTFTDVTDESGLGAYAYPDISAEWADYDNDGDLDVYVGGEMLTDTKWSPSQLFRNNGDGTFTEVARQAGVLNMRNVKGIAWGDYDNDGDQDLYVSNLGQPNRLYRNNGDGTFTDVGPELGVAEIPPFNRTFATWFFDANNDGWLDINVGGYADLGGNGQIGKAQVLNPI